MKTNTSQFFDNLSAFIIIISFSDEGESFLVLSKGFLFLCNWQFIARCFNIATHRCWLVTFRSNHCLVFCLLKLFVCRRKGFAAITSDLLIPKCCIIKNLIFLWQKQPLRGVFKKRCSENMQQIYRRTFMPKCDFNKVALAIDGQLI